MATLDTRYHPFRARKQAGLVILLLLASTPVAADTTLQRGIDLFVKEDYKAAQEAFEQAVEAEPNDAERLLWLGRAYGRRAERSTGFKLLGALSLAKNCRQSFEQAIAIDPTLLPALQSLFDYYINAPSAFGGGDDKAEALIPRMASVRPAAAERARASLQEKREEYSQAEASLRKAIEIEPGDIGHRLSLASFLSRRGRHDESDKLFAQLTQANPDAPQVWFSRAKALVRAKRNPDEAKRLLDRYLKTPLYAPDADPYSDARKLLGEL